MTLIMTWIDTRKIVQVCDQRLTMPDNTITEESAMGSIALSMISAT
jgi:hypothetical protein